MEANPTQSVWAPFGRFMGFALSRGDDKGVEETNGRRVELQVGFLETPWVMT